LLARRRDGWALPLVGGKVMSDSRARKTRQKPSGAVASRLGAELLSASVHGKKDAVLRLLQRGACVNFQNSAGETPLASAAGWDELAVAKLLLQHGADPNLADRSGGTALMLAAQHAKRAMVRLLLEHGASADASDKSGNSVLMHALWRERIGAEMTGIARDLLRHGADSHSRNRQSESALEIARSRGLTALERELRLSDGNPSGRSRSRLARRAVA
jgi:ankyrin repeat protein